MMEDSTLWNTLATTATGTVRWKAPELLSGDQRTVTKHSDMYAYGMTCFEVYSGRLPFYQYGNDGMVIKAVLFNGEIPERVGLSHTVRDDIWSMWTRIPGKYGSIISFIKSTNRGVNANANTAKSARWSWMLYWQGMGRPLNSHREMSMLVEVDMEIDGPRYHLWPSVLNLLPVEVPQPSFSSIDQIIKVNNTGCAILRAIGPTLDEKRRSERNCNSLQTLLVMNRVVVRAATVGFPDPENSDQLLTLVIFPPKNPGATAKLSCLNKLWQLSTDSF